MGRRQKTFKRNLFFEFLNYFFYQKNVRILKVINTRPKYDGRRKGTENRARTDRKVFVEKVERDERRPSDEQTAASNSVERASAFLLRNLAQKRPSDFELVHYALGRFRIFVRHSANSADGGMQPHALLCRIPSPAANGTFEDAHLRADGRDAA